MLNVLQLKIIALAALAAIVVLFGGMRRASAATFVNPRTVSPSLALPATMPPPLLSEDTLGQLSPSLVIDLVRCAWASLPVAAPTILQALLAGDRGALRLAITAPVMWAYLGTIPACQDLLADLGVVSSP